MLRNKNVYFTGKILNVRELANDNAKSFRFTADERKNLDLKGLPIRLEHEDCLEVGTIKANWNDNHGQHWIMGAIDKDSIPATFAKHSLMKKTGDHQPYYTGLSLQHVHREYPDGKTEKKGIEVSLCTDPRRPNCNVTWCSANNERKNSTYKLVREQATTGNKETKMEAPQVVPQEAQQTQQAPQENVEQSQAPTGQELSEQVYSQFAELMEKEKAQQEKIKKLEEELAKHNATLEEERKRKKDEDAAKGRALMSTFLEHVKELVGDQEDLQNTVEPLIAQNPDGMSKIMEVVSKASKKYQENNIALQKAQNELKDKQLELKFQQLIANKSLGQTSTIPAQAITEAASKKRQAPAEVAAKPAAAAVTKTVNPYAFKSQPRRAPQARRRSGGMNDMLLKMYQQNKGNGLKAMNKVHQGLSQRRQNY